MSSEKFGKSSVGDGRESWTTEPTVQPTLEIINSLATACVLKKKKMKNLYKKMEMYEVNVLHEPQFPAVNFKILSWTWSPEVHKMCPHTAHRFPQRMPRWEGQAQRGEAWGEHPTHITVLSKVGPGPLTTAQVPFASFFKNSPSCAHFTVMW